jgi:hypothetical protein
MNTVGVALTFHARFIVPSSSSRTGNCRSTFFTHAATFAWLSAMLTANTTRPLPFSSRCTSAMDEGNSLVQYGHQVAQK